MLMVASRRLMNNSLFKCFNKFEEPPECINILLQISRISGAHLLLKLKLFQLRVRPLNNSC